MKRTRKKKKRKRKKPRQAELQPLLVTSGADSISQQERCITQLQVRLQNLELARGYDGLLRGEPEPAVLVALYVVEAQRAQHLGRLCTRFQQPTRLPCVITPRETQEIKARVQHLQPALFVGVAIAIEEDSGKDLRELYASLEQPEAISLWSETSQWPEPLLLNELTAPGPGLQMFDGAHILVDGEHLSDRCQHDDLVAAIVFGVTGGQRYDSVQRLHFLSKGGLNDWTAVLRLRIGCRVG